MPVLGPLEVPSQSLPAPETGVLRTMEPPHPGSIIESYAVPDGKIKPLIQPPAGRYRGLVH
ncbi:hypothetical protein DFP92_11113 [Yoonia sediminilitoris]|uniref:Uncharacterized protein n=1 Tax=Yoonia sediminilitoris TaxID=1286148 RepID=A0A2T6KB33_9RHOB|nr:hypothetical protein C8N45_11114 [Yoonia sediminilitoris]RCW92864.1 hypothetical protein DFP92_11113 [Yoonia sediminilitoris]